MPCTVCQHNQIKDLDRALLTGATLTSLSRKYGFTTSALQRHQEHLMQKMAQAQREFHDSLRQGLFCKLNLVMEMVLGVVRGARAGEDFKLFLQASREFTRIISLMLKMDVPLGPEMIYCLMSSPQWDLQDNLLPNAFQTLSDTRQTLKVNLFAACPEPEPNQTRFQLSPQLPKLKTWHQKPLIRFFLSKLETRNLKLCLPCPAGLRSLPPNRHPKTGNWQPTRARKTSAKLARN